jgi:hypothetical protein
MEVIFDDWILFWGKILVKSLFIAPKQASFGAANELLTSKNLIY